MLSAAQQTRSNAVEPPAVAGFQTVHPAVLLRVGCGDIDLFLASPDGASPILLRGAGVELHAGRTESLLATLDEPVLVRESDFARLSTGLLGRLEEIVTDDDTPAGERFLLLQTAAAAAIELASTLIDPSRFIAVSRQMGSAFSDLMSRTDLAPDEILAIARHDNYTFSHVTNVCCYSIAFASSLGIAEGEELNEIAVGALLHDAGKRHVPLSILRKKGALTRQEWEIIHRHPQQGFEDLSRAGSLTLNQLLMVYQHHERMDGRGYPVGLIGAQMHPWSKLLAVVDVFDALTGRRPYRPPLDPKAAIRHLINNAGSQLDKEMVRRWCEIMRIE